MEISKGLQEEILTVQNKLKIAIRDHQVRKRTCYTCFNTLLYMYQYTYTHLCVYEISKLGISHLSILLKYLNIRKNNKHIIYHHSIQFN